MARRYLTVISISAALACSACSNRPSQGVLIPLAASVRAEGTDRVPILVATTRQRTTADAGEMFGSERAADVSYAAITVSIPPDASRKIGEVQWPATLPGDPRTDFVTISADYTDKQSFLATITAVAKQTGRSKVLVFVHGFNNRFDDAVYRFAQIVHDSKAPAIPVLFTWPSRGETKLRAYTYDRESANYSRDALEDLLNSLTGLPAITEVNLLAHSMGNWVALEALRRIDRPRSASAAFLKPDTNLENGPGAATHCLVCFSRRFRAGFVKSYLGRHPSDGRYRSDPGAISNRTGTRQDYCLRSDKGRPRQRCS
jgi:esterase/lipase superfamily enzyme